MPELKNIDIKYVSLVKKGANQRQIQIYKSADAKPQNSNEDELRGFFDVMKSFFTGKKEAKKEKKEGQVDIGKSIETKNQADIKKGDAGMKQEEIQKMVTDAVAAAIEPINKKLEDVEKEEAPTAEESNEISKEDIASIVEQAIEKAVDPIVQRVEAVEKARGLKKSVDDDEGEESIEKSSEGVFAGTFL